ncbi:GbsR/MarR family transcriptional regulator [Saccharomonospora cyanea]|uniref:Putative transcriptional regulator n=1 Tax=Saccharomonospora cyanea NA-134 TaxID=882082 RepID=H5XDG7_9PSEU|nr:MarR family transcriptional regulator [Saccharomonospora cyanea]EHR60259.1 putative transcriptional regulator [Saccharomonospora cyanea NA-134]
MERSPEGGRPSADMSPAEELALTLTRNGLQRMTARVLAALLFTEQETLTAGELGERLRASAGSVSTALRTLTTTGLVERVPVPGSTRTHYRCPDDAWVRLMSTQNEVVRAMLAAAERGIEAAGDDSAAGRRLTTMRDFYAYLMSELPLLLDRWRRPNPGTAAGGERR